MDNKDFITASDSLKNLLSDIDPDVLELDDFLFDIAVQLVDLRDELNLLQKDVAEMCNIRQSMVSKMESGHYNPSVASLWRYAKAIGAELRIDIQKSKTANVAVELISEEDIKPTESIISHNDFKDSLAFNFSIESTTAWGGQSRCPAA